MDALKRRFQSLRRRWVVNIGRNREVEYEAGLSTLDRIFWSAPLMALASIAITILFSFKNERPFSIAATWRLGIIKIHLIIIVGCLLCWTAAWKLRKSKPNEIVLTIFKGAVAAFVLSVGVAITLVDLLVMRTVTPLVVTSVIAATFYYLKPSHSALLFATGFAVFHAAILRRIDVPLVIMDSVLANALVALLLGYVLSILNWNNFCFTQLQKRQIEQQQAVLERMAYQDSLTKLPNRRLLDEVLRREIHLVKRSQIESALIIFDLDGFKAVNDTYGHPVGDQVLQELAYILQKSMRGSDTFVRLGGEEFVVLASSTSLANAVSFAERLRVQVADHLFLAEDYQIRLTASFGVAPILGVEEYGNCYKLADQALYRAKEKGKNKVEFIGQTEAV